MARVGWRRRRGPREVRQEVDEELRFHLAVRRAELEDDGLSPIEAREEAMRRFGDLATTRSRCVDSQLRKERRMRHREFLDDLLQDLHVGGRTLLRRPAASTAAVLTLAVAVAAAVVVFSIADHVVLRPLPYRHAERVVTLWQHDLRSGDRTAVAPGNFLAWEERAGSFSHLGLAQPSGYDLTGDGPPVPVSAWRVSEGFFPTLGVAPIVGRLFRPEDYQAQGTPAILISEGLWRRRFAADPSIVEHTIGLDGEQVRVAGVLPASLEYPDPREIYAPKRFQDYEREDRRSNYMLAVGRLRPTASLASARSEMTRLSELLAEEHPESNRNFRARLVPLREEVLGAVTPAMNLLLGAVALLVLIAASNVAGLLLARGLERLTELGVRAAVGATRSRLRRQLATESLLLTTLGGGLGIALAAAAVPLTARLLPADLPRAASVELDGRVLAFAVGLTAVCGLLASLAPAWRLSRPELSSLLHSDRATEDPARARLRHGLVTAEIALALVLLVTSGLLARSFGRLLANDLGFEPRGRIELQVFLWDRNPTAEAREQRAEELEQRFAALPGVREVGLVSALPFHPSAIDVQADVRVKDRRADAGTTPAVFSVASPAYFRALAIPLLSGRPFGPGDRADAPRVALISESLAGRAFPREDPLGRSIVVGSEVGRAEGAEDGLGTWEIVGTVDDVRSGDLGADPRPEVYVPFHQYPTGSVTFVLAADGDAGALLAQARQVVWQVDPEQSVYHSAALSDLVAASLAQRRFQLVVVVGFSLVALLLAGLGTFALVSYSTRQRTHEYGIRLALGAAPRDVLAAALRQGAHLGLPGILLGSLGALLLSGALEPLLYGIAPGDPATLLSVAGVMLGVALLGAWLPGRRAARLHPAAALREP